MHVKQSFDVAALRCSAIAHDHVGDSSLQSLDVMPL